MLRLDGCAVWEELPDGHMIAVVHYVALGEGEIAVIAVERDVGSRLEIRSAGKDFFHPQNARGGHLPHKDVFVPAAESVVVDDEAFAGVGDADVEVRLRRAGRGGDL